MNNAYSGRSGSYCLSPVGKPTIRWEAYSPTGKRKT